jgi:RHS repeat-associated protein
VTGYRLWRCQGASCTNFVEVGQFNGSQTSTGNSSLQPGTTYSYKVRAADAQLNFSDFSNVATATTLDTTAPTAPTGLTATAVSGSQINLSWAASTDNVGVTGYRVERCQGAACSLFVEVATPAQTSYSSTSLAPASSYTFRVRAIDGAGNLSAFSAAATATTFTVQTQLYFIHADHLNTPRLVADAAGTTVWKWDQQEPFGVNVPDENPSGLGAFEFPVRFPGQYFDKETNLSYNYYRDYDPALGRYTRSDPTGLKGGLNSYSYSGNNPVSFIDPAGLFKCWWVGFVLHCQFGPPPPGPLDWPSDKSGGSSNSNSSEDEKGNDAQCEREDYCSKILQREEALCVSIAGPRYPGNPGQAITICQKAAFQRYIKCKQGLPEHEWPPLTGVDTPI